MVDDKAEGKPGIGKRASDIDAGIAATQGGGFGADFALPLVLRAFGHQIDYPARILLALEERGWPFEHFDMIHCRHGEGAPGLANAVDQRRTIAVAAKAAFDIAILGAPHIVAFGDPRNHRHRLSEAVDIMIGHHLGGDRLYGAGFFQKRHRLFAGQTRTLGTITLRGHVSEAIRSDDQCF